MAQYGTKHGHARGKFEALKRNPEVELVGIFEPDMRRRKELTETDSLYRDVLWFDDKNDMLQDSSIVAIASEGRNDESLDQTEEIVKAGKHVWYDKPAGDDWDRWKRLVALAKESGCIIQMGYMFRYHLGFQLIDEWVKSEVLGDVFAVRANMSTWVGEESRKIISRHPGGIFYDLAGHMLDQVVWILGRPLKVQSFFRNDTGIVPQFKDNTLAVFEYEKAMAFVDIAAMEPKPTARRFEVYGSLGSAIMEPFEPASSLRLCLQHDRNNYRRGEQRIPIRPQTRQELYELELNALLSTVNGVMMPDRSLDHELLVQETLIRAIK